MEPERWGQIERLYHCVLEQEKEQRIAFLKQACEGDEELRRELESLLAQAGKTGSFDVVVWGGPARLRYHGVTPLKEGYHPSVGGCRINLTFRKAA